MPQDIPLEASKKLAFTPPSLAGVVDPPTFMLRAATWREKDHINYLRDLHRVRFHSTADQRDAVVEGLRNLWGEERFETHRATVEGYWQAVDEWEVARKNEPGLKFAFDPEIEKAVLELLDRVGDAWEPVARIEADIRRANQVNVRLVLSVVVDSWSGIGTTREIEQGYLSLDCVDAMSAALAEAGEIAALGTPSLPVIELYLACCRRLGLIEEEVGNFGSPSPSPTLPASSTADTPGPGPSPASKSRSRKTRKAA